PAGPCNPSSLDLPFQGEVWIERRVRPFQKADLTGYDGTMKNSFVSAAIVIAAASCPAVLTTAAGVASAAEVKFLSAGALTPAMRELVPQFERSSGHKVTIVYGNINALADRVDKGEAVDVVISSPARSEALVKAGRVVPNSTIRI